MTGTSESAVRPARGGPGDGAGSGNGAGRSGGSGNGAGRAGGARGGARRPRLSRRRRQLRLLIPLGAIVLVIAIAISLSGGGATPSPRPPVSVFPIPGSRVATPQTQIAFRGISPRQLAHIVVRGSKSGLHRGRVERDSDGHGGSFVAAKPFVPGEQVTVQTRLEIAGARGGTFHFTVAHPASALPLGTLHEAARVPGDVFHFYSRPDLAPAAVELAHDGPRAPGGDVFLTPQQGPIRNGPMIVAPSGQLVWFDPVPKGDLAADFRVQRYHGRPVLTWWQGQVRGGVGFGNDVVMSSSYRRLATIAGANGLRSDLHAFRLTRAGTAWVTAYFPVWWDASSVHGPRRQVVLDSVVQEIDLKTGLVLFQWDSLDHVPLRDSYTPLPKSPSKAYDYFHVNSIAPAPGGRLVISGRATWAVYELDPHTGRVVWTLGGKNSSFRMGPGVPFAFQHDVQFLPHQSRLLSVYDDGAGPPTVHKQSRAITIRLNYRHMTASLVRADEHNPSITAYFEGNVQDLSGGGQFVGWGGAPYFSEFDRTGRLIFDARFVGHNSSYRAFVYPWRANPQTLPAVATASDGASETVYASWNGATQVAQWRVLGGTSPKSLVPVALTPEQGFESSVRIVTKPYVAVQALGADGRVLATSRAVRSQ